MLFGMSIFQIITILLVLMLVVGPQKLPEYAKKAGTFLRNVRRYTTDLGKDLTGSLLNEEKKYTSTSKSNTDLFGSTTSKSGKSLSSFLDNNDK